MSSKVLYAIYEEGDDLLHAVEKVRSKGMDVIDCFTPYPVHGLDGAMGIKRSRLPIAAFICAMLGLTSAISLQYFTMGYDWPMIIGGKPYVGLPSWIPVCFELSILFTAYGMGILFFIKSRMVHGVEADLADIRQTDNRLVMALNVSDSEDTSSLESLLQDTNVSEIRKPYEDSSDSEVAGTVTSEVAAPKFEKKESPAEKPAKQAASAKLPELSEEEKAEKVNLLLSKVGRASDDSNDDLKKVKGIGPVFEKNLNSIGINSFAQIAKMDNETIATHPIPQALADNPPIEPQILHRPMSPIERIVAGNIDGRPVTNWNGKMDSLLIALAKTMKLLTKDKLSAGEKKTAYELLEQITTDDIKKAVDDASFKTMKALMSFEDHSQQKVKAPIIAPDATDMILPNVSKDVGGRINNG